MFTVSRHSGLLTSSAWWWRRQRRPWRQPLGLLGLREAVEERGKCRYRFSTGLVKVECSAVDTAIEAMGMALVRTVRTYEYLSWRRRAINWDDS